MTTPVNGAYLPARPGNIKMKCLIWHNHPICARFEQSEQFPLNSETLKSLPQYIQNKVMSSPGLDGVWLRPKIVYKSNFLRIKDELLETYRKDVQSYFDPTLFPDILSPVEPWVPHHMWKLDGSLFDPNMSSPSENLAGSDESKSPHFSKWTHEVVAVPSDELSAAQQAAAVAAAAAAAATAALAADPSNPDAANAAVTANGAAANAAIKAAELKSTYVFMPSQYAVGNNAAVNNDSDPRGIHWKVTKEQPLFQKEDFWIEFRPRAYATDQQEDHKNLDPKYNYLDSAVPMSGGTVVNGGVVEVDENGAIVPDSIKSFNLNSQPYYMIEMGAGGKHHYIIILAYNAPARFIQVSNEIPVLSKIDDKSGLVIQLPNQLVSRLLSVYNDVDTKALINQESLRVSVRQHLGYIVITFSGHEDAPWVIKREDPVQIDGSPNWSTNPSDYKAQTVPMIIDSKPISLYGGNIKSCWSFGPMIYESKASITLPQAILVKGPVVANDIYLRLSEPSPNDSPTGASPYLYYQEAEEYREFFYNAPQINPAYYVRPEHTLQYGAAPTKITKPNSNKKNELPYKNSYIQILPKTSVTSGSGSDSSGGSDSSSSSGDGGQDQSGDGNADNLSNPLTDATLMNQYFYAEYTLSAGDYVFLVPETPITDVKITAPYKIENCITPVATGWWLNVPAAGRAAVPAIIDASPIVMEFSDNWSAQDFVKIDHTGNIKFLVSKNQTGFSATDNIQVNGSNLNGDIASYVASLHNKTFFLRVYAWWEDGFGACTPDCNNCGGGGCTDACCIFTGFAHGGVITTKGSAQKVMECQLFDYMKILQDGIFLNSPFFDGMRDFNAIYHILKLCGFRDGTENDMTVGGGFLSGLSPSRDPHPPARLIKILSDSTLADNISINWPPGCASSQLIHTWEYVLPSAYDVLQSPKFKFSDTSKMEEGINKIASIAAKTFYFDSLGYFHYENRIEDQISFTGFMPSPKMRFFASPIEMTSPSGCLQQYRQVLGEYTFKHNVADVVTSTYIMTSTPDGGPIFGGAVNYPARYDPTSPGYIGYQKMFFQTDGVFGNLEGVQKTIDYYKSFQFTAPVSVSFEAYGTGQLKPLDIVTFTGMKVDDIELDNQPFRLTGVSSTINPQTNEWRTKFEAEWFNIQTSSPTGQE